MFTKKEQFHLIISVLILTLVFGFDDGAQTFVLRHWFLNLILMFLFIVVALFFREFVVKFFAKRHDARSEYEIWRMKRFWFSGETKKGVPIGIIFSIIFTLGSLGKFFFAAIGIHNLTEYKSSRVGRKQATLNYFEEAQIVAMGILSSLFLAIIGVIVGIIFNIDMTKFVNINFFIALFNMLPLSQLDGAKIFFGSIFLYIFIALFVIVAFLLINFSLILSLILAFLAAIIGVVVYFYLSNF